MSLQERQIYQNWVKIFKYLLFFTVCAVIGFPFFFALWTGFTVALIKLFGTGEYYPTGYGLDP